MEWRYPVVYNRSEPDKEQHFIRICACKRGLKAIDSPLKVKIIEMLAGGEMDFEDIVSRSGRAKSTISAHLNALTEAGITISRPDPADARRRLFSLKGKILLRTIDPDRDKNGSTSSFLKSFLSMQRPVMSSVSSSPPSA